jgi:hypothetical protein
VDDALEYLRSVYNDPLETTFTRVRAAQIAIEYERPRLAVTALINGQAFADQLDRAVARSQTVMKIIDAKSEKPVIPPIVEKDVWLPTVPDMRRFRRRV